MSLDHRLQCLPDTQVQTNEAGLIRKELLGVAQGVRQMVLLNVRLCKGGIEEIAVLGVFDFQEVLGIELVGGCQLVEGCSLQLQGINILRELPHRYRTKKSVFSQGRRILHLVCSQFETGSFRP